MFIMSATTHSGPGLRTAPSRVRSHLIFTAAALHSCSRFTKFEPSAIWGSPVASSYKYGETLLIMES